MSKEKKSDGRLSLNTMQMIALGFLGVILLGGVLLWLPFSNQEPIAFADALFTSVSAVRVTGLLTIVPATQFTVAGKVILLLLIQIGGLGVIACTVAFFLILRKKITMKERVIIQQTYGLDTLSGLVKYMLLILKGNLSCGGIGACCYAFRFVPEFGVVKGSHTVFSSRSRHFAMRGSIFSRSELQRLCDVADRELHNDGADRSERSRISCVA